MASAHSPYRASSPSRKYSDYLGEAPRVEDVHSRGQDSHTNKYRSSLQDHRSRSPARQHSPYRGSQHSSSLMDRNGETNILSSATFGGDKAASSFVQDRTSSGTGEFDYPLPSRAYGKRTQAEIG